jgi:hypothetical protein
MTNLHASPNSATQHRSRGLAAAAFLQLAIATYSLEEVGPGIGGRCRRSNIAVLSSIVQLGDLLLKLLRARIRTCEGGHGVRVGEPKESKGALSGGVHLWHLVNLRKDGDKDSDVG